MSLNNFAKIVTNGLVFSYDSSSIQSYKGPPLTNLIASKSPLTASGTGYSFVGRTELTKVPYFGAINCSVVDIQNNYSAVSTWCCPNPMSYGSATVSPSTTYTYLIMYKCDSGYTNPNYMYRYEYTASGGSYVTEQGVHNDANRVNMGDGWYYAWGTFTTSATTNYLTGLASFYYRYSTLYDTFKVAKVALVQGNYAGLHPKYWPEHSQTRTNTQTLVDVFGNNTITANSLTYASDGTFSFNGTTDYMSVGTSSNWAFGANGTVEQWIRPTNSTGNDRLWCVNNTAASLDAYLNGTTYALYMHGGVVGTTTSLTQNSWNHVVVTYTSGTIKIYFNGVEQTLTGTTTGYNITNNATLYIGEYQNLAGYKMYGSIPVMRVYNRGLSASEVIQNFNALRGRYGQ